MRIVRQALGRQLVLAWKRRWLGLALSWMICLGGWTAIGYLPNQYASSAQLYVDTDAVLTPLLHGIAIDECDHAEIRHGAVMRAGRCHGLPDQFGRDAGALGSESAAHPCAGPLVLDVVGDRRRRDPERARAVR